MVSTVVVGLKERQMKCGYEVKEVVEKIKKKKISDSQLNSVIYPGRVSAGDVWIHVGRWLQPEFFEHCKRLAEQQVYCILYQSDPFNVTAPVGVCEIWEYTHGNFPQAPVVRTIPAGFLPLWKHGNDQEVEKRSHDFNLQKLQWVFMGHLNKANRMQCWNHLRTMPELQHVSFTNHIRGFRDAETWKKLARKLGVNLSFIDGKMVNWFLNIGQQIGSKTFFPESGQKVFFFCQDAQCDLFEPSPILQWDRQFDPEIGDGSHLLRVELWRLDDLWSHQWSWHGHLQGSCGLLVPSRAKSSERWSCWVTETPRFWEFWKYFWVILGTEVLRVWGQDIVVFEKNLFLNYSSWSWQLKDLLRSSHRIKAFQRKAYTLYKQKFAPGMVQSGAKWIVVKFCTSLDSFVQVLYLLVDIYTRFQAFFPCPGRLLSDAKVWDREEGPDPGRSMLLWQGHDSKANETGTKRIIEIWEGSNLAICIMRIYVHYIYFCILYCIYILYI